MGKRDHVYILLLFILIMLLIIMFIILLLQSHLWTFSDFFLPPKFVALLIPDKRQSGLSCTALLGSKYKEIRHVPSPAET